MKTLYLVRQRNDGGSGDSLAAQAVASGLSFTSKYLHEDALPWADVTIRATPSFVIDVDKTIHAVFEGSADVAYNHAAMVTAWGAAPTSPPAPTPPLIVPFVTPAQAAAWLKTFLEKNPTTWTTAEWATQERFAAYALILLAFHDFKTGKVY